MNKTMISLHFNTFCVKFLKTLATYYFLKMIILNGKLMRFNIYVDNVQQYMRALQAKFVKMHTL